MRSSSLLAILAKLVLVVSTALCSVFPQVAVGSGRAAVSGTDGRVAAVVPPGPSRTIDLAYEPVAGGGFVAQAEMFETVDAGLTLRATPTRTGPEGAVTLEGRGAGRGCRRVAWSSKCSSTTRAGGSRFAHRGRIGRDGCGSRTGFIGRMAVSRFACECGGAKQAFPTATGSAGGLRWTREL